MKQVLKVEHLSCCDCARRLDADLPPTAQARGRVVEKGAVRNVWAMRSAGGGNQQRRAVEHGVKRGDTLTVGIESAQMLQTEPAIETVSTLPSRLHSGFLLPRTAQPWVECVRRRRSQRAPRALLPLLQLPHSPFFWGFGRPACQMQ